MTCLFFFRKPSYVGLSCAVSGYSNFIRYTSPSRKNSPPQTFRVESGPQVLDNSSMKSLPPVRGQQQVNIKTSSDLIQDILFEIIFAIVYTNLPGIYMNCFVSS